MTIQTATILFASLVICCVIIAYSEKTKQLPPIVAKALAVCASFTLAIIASLALAGFDSIQRQPAKELAGVRLAESEDDLIFKKGKFLEVCYFDEERKKKLFTFSGEEANPDTISVVMVETWDNQVKRVIQFGEIEKFELKNAEPVARGTSLDALRDTWGNEDFFL